MIAPNILTYLLSFSDLTDLLASPTNIFLVRAPSDDSGSATVEMPWIVIDTPSPGSRQRLTGNHKQPNEVVHILCDGPDQFQAMEIANLALSKLDNYRGDMLSSKDSYLQCGTIYFMDGYGGTMSAVFRVRCISLESLTHPTPIV